MSYLWGSRHRDDLVRRDRAVGGSTLNETRYILMDYFNPSAITDEAGVVKERYAFSAFGVRTILNADYTVRSSSESAMEFGFQGQFLDTESGLMNYGYRYYAPYLGRWTCKDPIDNISNLYASSDNHPTNEVDHLGAETYAQFVKRCEQSAKPKCQSQGKILVSWRVVGAGAGVRPNARGYQFWAAWVCEVKCGECTPEEKARRQALKNAACGQDRSCKNTDNCAKIRRCIQNGLSCEQARRLVMDCFLGGDQAHKDEVQEVAKTTHECMRKYVALGCERQR
jgi:RHS repeat-associated protein